MTRASRFSLRRPLAARDISESHRTASPLELLFDLTFVAAVAQIALQLARAIADGHAGEAIGPFLMVFFAIWWAWMNFTWFASAYDNDDVLYRLLTVVQMAGVLVVAAGVPASFNDGNFLAVTIGYLVMRIGLVALWLRAAMGDGGGKDSASRYVIGITVVQAGWLLRLLVPEAWLAVCFVVLALAELSVPVWAAATGESRWHPHHIAERYGLFTIILLGESVLAATNGVQRSLEVSGMSTQLVVAAVAGLALVFGLWWLYYLEPAGDGLQERRGLSYMWGYGHYGVFASLAALGAGLEVVVEATGHHLEISSATVAFAVAIPVAVFLVLLWAVHAPLVTHLVINPAVILPAALVMLALPLLAPVVGLPTVMVAIATVCAAVIGVTIVDKERRAARAGVAA